MRLGAYPCLLTPGSKAAIAYGASEITERHRHRYEVNNEYREALTSHGMLISGVSPDKRLVEMVELPQHPYFVGCQFHPEFKSRPQAPHPLFQSFVAAALHARLGDRGRRSAEVGASPAP
jgi:CTP synthase